MFKFIGMVTVALVIAVGYPAIKKWYEGDVSAEDAVSEIKSSVGRSLISGEEASSPPAKKEPVLAAGSKTQSGSSDKDDFLDAEKLFEELDKK